MTMRSMASADSRSANSPMRSPPRRTASAIANALGVPPQQKSPPSGADDAHAREAAAAQAVARAHGEVRALGLPIGWKGWNASADDLRRAPDTLMDWVLKIVGVLLTGFAVSQGAPFWFDLLNKVMVIRSTVKPKEKSTEQPSKDRPAPETQVENDGDKPVAKG